MKEKEGPFSESLASQVIATDISYNKDAIKIGPYHFRCISLKSLPQEATHAGLADHFKLPFHYWLSQSIEIPKQQREVEKLQISRRIASAMSHGDNNVSDLESESRLSAIENTLCQIMDGQERIVRMSFNVIVWAKNISELNDKSNEVLKAYRGMGQSEGLVETLASLEAFLTSMPGACENFREKVAKSSNCAHLMPVYGYWTGNSLPVCLLSNPEGSLCGINPFEPSLANFNALIFGGSGSGKSFNILQLIIMFAAQKSAPKVIWIDNGASSKRLLEVLGGEFIDIHLESKLRLNPFEGIPTPGKIKLLLACIEIMLQDSKIPKLHKALLEEAIFETYKKENPDLSAFRKILENHSNKDMNNYAKTLYSWTSERPFGKLLDGPSNIDLAKRLITIEIKGLDDYPDLQQVMLLLLTDFIKQTPKSLLIIDEAWRLFSGSGEAFAIEAYRTFRKYGSGIWCISQNYQDFLSDKSLSRALLPNTATVLILQQTGIDWNDLQDKLQLNEQEIEAIKGIHTVKGSYSDFLLIQGGRKCILQISPHHLSYWVATSDPGDNAKIDEMKKKYPDLSTIEVLKKLPSQHSLWAA